MREPFTQIYLHAVWATWDRLPLLQGEIQAAVCDCIQAECTRMKVELLAIGGIEDHIHVLARLPVSQGIPDFIKQIKGSSSHLITHQVRPDAFFKWQGAYGAFTLAKADVARLRHYILHQSEHHRGGSVDPDQELPL